MSLKNKQDKPKYELNPKQEKIIQQIRANNEGLKVYRSSVRFRTILIVVLSVIAFLLIVFGSLFLTSKAGLFTVGVGKMNEMARLSLYDNREFENPTERLTFKTPDKLDNIDGDVDIPNGLELLDGENCGWGYLAYTFYVKNVGAGNCEVTAEITISDVLKGTDEAMRIKVFENDIPETYAKIAKTTGLPEPGTIAFVDKDVAYRQNFILNVDDVQKYTIVVWLEGWDPECIDNILGGFVRLDMTFTAQAISK